ncbi:type II toxin-antitoxin system RelE/ParE family toxin [Thiobacillus denitrificans]|uniref:type II toxin-antitoxin system RelE/ParE family toxin n=1 Tax=Thiobacillus denitrificans TaxID=36861 RepID=UPI003CC7E75F
MPARLCVATARRATSRGVRATATRACPNSRSKFKGDRKGSWSIRINDQWRICFRFENGNAYDVEIVDYH